MRRDLTDWLLEINAMVEPHYVVIPEEVVFARSGDGKATLKREASITITPKNDPELQILEAYATHPSVRVAKVHPGSTAGSTTIHIDFDPARCIATTVRAELVIRTDSKLEPVHRVPIRVVSNGSH
jgi:hypothetical protein